MGDQKPEDIKKQIEELNKKLKEAGGLGIDFQDAMRRAGDDTQKLNKYLDQLNKQYNDLVDNADYIYRTFQDITAELKNQNVLLKIGRGSFKEFTDIAQDLNYYQKGNNDLTDKQFTKIKNSIGLQKSELQFVVQRLEASKRSRDLEYQQLLSLEQRTTKQNARLKELTKENELLVNAKEALKSGIPIIEKELNLTKQIADTRKDLGGIAQATGKVLSQFGGSLANFLNISEATEAVEEYNKKLIQGALNNEKVQDKLLKIEKQRKEIEEDASLNEEQKQTKINALNEEAYKIKQAAIASVNTLGNKFKSLGVLVGELGVGLKKSLLDPTTLITFFIGKALQANAQSVQLGKSLGFGADKANKFRENLADMARFSTNINVTTENLVGAFTELSTATGFVANYSQDTLETQIMLTKQLGLSGEEAAGIYQYSVLTGKSSSQVNDSMVGAFVAARNSLKVGVDFKAVMAEAAKVSGQLSANFKNNPELITKAIVQAKALGTTLEQTKSQGEKLLDFESSIESELKAELLTGQQMNLERARAAALQGDQVTVMKELANQGMTLNKFQSMNVVAQKSFAEALGLSADQLTEQLKKQKMAQESGKSLAQITKEEALEAEKRQSVQDKFNQAILKLQDFFGNLIAGPVGQLLETLTNIIGLVVNVLQPVLATIFTPISWAVSWLGKMEGILKTIAVVYLAIKGYQLGLNIARGIEEAQMITKLGLMEGELTTAGLIEAMQGRSLLTKIALVGMNAKMIIQEKLKALFSKDTLNSIIAQIARIPALLGLKSAEAAVETEIAGAATVAAEATTFGAATAWIVGGLAAVLGAMAMFKGDDVVSPGYGKRTLMAPEGAIALNDKDTVIAGTNLGGGEGGGKGENAAAPQIDLTPVTAALAEVKAAIDRLYNKESTVKMDSTKVGTTLTQNSPKAA